MCDRKDIVLTVDYHPNHLEVRWLHCATGEERCFRRPTTRDHILRLLDQAREEAAPLGGQVIWIMESTSGWARVQELVLQRRARFILANVLQMPLAPKGHRRKSDRIDTARIQREYGDGKLPMAYQPSAWLRQVRRLADMRMDLARRRTEVQNWIWHYLSHETWYGTKNLWSGRGLDRLRKLALPERDRFLMDLKVRELEQIEQLLEDVEQEMMRLYPDWPEAQAMDEVRGIGPITAMSILAYIGPVGRFKTAEELISYAGLAPGVHQSDGTRYGLRIGGGGTHSRLRYFVMQATRWLAQIERYRPSYQRVLERRGKKVARVVVARMFLRSLHKMLRCGLAFQAAAA